MLLNCIDCLILVYSRVKSMVMVNGPGSSDVSLVTASSDGFIKIFKLSFQVCFVFLLFMRYSK